MATILRYAVASPRKQYNDNGTSIDLAYITTRLIVCSMPTSEYVKTWYRITTQDLREFLLRNHGTTNWRLFNFRAEQGKAYRDEEFNGQVSHYPFPDHHPPPFHIIPEFVDALDKFLQLRDDNVAVLHCKAEQGRSGTMSCAYLMIAEGYSKQDAINLFTEKRMRVGFGSGVSIHSQRRYLGYVEDWLLLGQPSYNREQAVQILSLTVYNPQYPDLEIDCLEYTPNGASIKLGYSFGIEKDVVERTNWYIKLVPSVTLLMRPDVQFSINHRSKRKSRFGLSNGLSFLHSTATCWFNTVFETLRSGTKSGEVGEVELMWDEMDGFLGTHKRGSKSFHRVKVQWRLVPNSIHD